MNSHFKLLSKNKLASKVKFSEESNLAPRNSNSDLPDMPIYYQSWVKYFHYQKLENDTSKKPNFFFRNGSFKSQDSNKPDHDDQFGGLKIPSETSFFAVVYEDKINFLSSREAAFLRVADSLSLSLVHDIPEDDIFKGGVKDLGKFQEGYCFQVKTREPLNFFQMTEKETIPEKGVDKTWFICSEKEDIKNRIMNLIIKLRLKKQHSVGVWLKKNNAGVKMTVSNILSQSTSQAPAKPDARSVQDGYWVLLQDWTPCSQKCGGGVQFQHLLCNPPKNGGKPCEGVAVREKPCNPQACPSSNETEQVLLPKGKERMNTPIIKLLPISSRPLRYDKCHLKEGDVIYTPFRPGVGLLDNQEKIPSRVIMNEKTVSVFTNENLETMLATFVIEKTSFKTSARDNACFILESENSKGEFCKITNDSKINFLDEWNYDYSLFKIQCNTARDTVALNLKEEKDLQDELEKKIDMAKIDVIKERTKKIQQKVHEAPVSKVDKLQETAMLAMKKELAIDGLLQKEELEREEAEARELKQQLETEKKKDECLIKSIKEKELEDQYNVSKIQQDKELNELKEQAKQQILQKRKQVKMKILQMRKRAERKKQIYQDEITSLRNQVASELNKHNKEGNMNMCFKPSNSDEHKKKVTDYCNANFTDANPNKYKECLSEEEFCFVCCENEFGEIHVNNRELCYDKCDEVPRSLNKPGSWQWTENASINA